jgi:hypothetical protein
MSRTIDYSPLLGAVTSTEIRAFRTAARSRGSNWGAFSVAQLVSGALIGAVVALVLVSSLFSLAGIIIDSALGGGDLVAVVAPLAVLLVLGGAVAVILRSLFGARRWERLMRMDRFAAANGLVFSPRDAAPAYPGAIFTQGRAREARDHFRSADGRFLDFGNFSYVTGSGKNQQRHAWGFLALKLDRNLPHMVLDARANNGIFGSTLPGSLAKDQVLSLEGDFDRHFTLYCPRAYERDALYVFTPDLMALLIDEAAAFDIEIVDDWFFLYSPRVFPLADPATYQRLLRIVDTVGAKTLTQSDGYVDDRFAAGGYVNDRFSATPQRFAVAPQGRRLRTRFPGVAILVVTAFVVLWGWSVVSGLLN